MDSVKAARRCRRRRPSTATATVVVLLVCGAKWADEKSNACAHALARSRRLANDFWTLLIVDLLLYVHCRERLELLL